MFKRLQNLTKREAAGALSGKQLSVGSRVVRVDKLLGEGGFATIYRCTDVETGAVYALKHFILTGYPDAERDASAEVGVMEALAGCPHVVRLHEATLGGLPGAPPTAAFALLEFCPDTLPAYLAARGWRLDDDQLLRVALPVARAVAAMHALEPPLAHRDLKAENVLLSGSGRWVLCDFGSASARQGVLASAADIALEEEVVRRYTTPAYRAPELYDLYAREHVGLPVDVWALGVLLYLLAIGRLPFEGEAKLQVLNGRFAMPEGRPEPLRALIRDCLVVAPLKRPTAQQVVARLEAMAPPDLMEALGGGAPASSAAQARTAAAAASAASGTGPGVAAAGAAPPLHSRLPSQGWADFGSDAGSVASPGSGGGSAAHSRHHSGTLASWATFSPKRAAEVVAGATAAVAASAGSFWSSFGEEAPSEAQEPSEQQPKPQPPPQQAAQAAPAAAPAAPAAPPRQALGVSPLSAGLARMHLGGSAAPQQCQPAATAAAAAPGEDGGMGGAGEADMLREHCRVLEQLLQEKTEEIVLLRRQAEQQAAQIHALRQHAQQAEAAAAAAGQQPAASMAASAAAAGLGGGVASTPSSSRVGQDVPSLHAPGSGDSWISFGGGGGAPGSGAPTPTLLQPATGSSFRGSSGAAAAGGPVATPMHAPHPSEEALRARLDLSSASLAGQGARASAGLLVTPHDEPLRQLPMRSNSGSRLAGAGSAGAIALSGASSSGSSITGGSSGGLQSFPVALTPGPSPLAVEGSRSAPPSAKPSPSRTDPAAVNGGGSPPAQPASPKLPRPGSSLSGRSLSPARGASHRRNLTAPGSGFFDDLDPLSH